VNLEIGNKDIIPLNGEKSSHSPAANPENLWAGERYEQKLI
jgi:hypothetical protein